MREDFSNLNIQNNSDTNKFWGCGGCKEHIKILVPDNTARNVIIILLSDTKIMKKRY